ncbi:MAG: hypothetical protein M3P26_14170 [Gemmatimonadota bacterium]|nr:hypothetical protein [Gemmatimonadota bacterium]
MTKARARPATEALEIVREIIRRAGHEIRNALNGVAVNVEVVRSRVTHEVSTKDVVSFAERAASQVGETSALTDGLLALVSSVLAAQSEGTLKAGRGGSAGTRIELMIYGDRAPILVSDIKRLADRIGVGVEQRADSVILTILPEGKSHSKD